MRLLSHSAGPVPPLQPRASRWSTALSPALHSLPGNEAAIELLQAPGALVVTTGQQPGLFTGPAYTVHKALAAAALAAALSARWQRPVVPLFWLAGDDHDFTEASTASWLDADGTLREWHLEPRDASAPQRSLSREILPSAILSGLRVLEQSLPAGPDRDATLAWLRKHYVPGHTLHEACAGAVAELLAPFGVVCIDPTRVEFKRAQRPVLRQALEHAAELDAALAALPAADTGITAGEGATLVFYEGEAGRDRLLIDGPGFRGRRTGVQFSREEIFRELDAQPERFSANVLLRPVVEAALLPTVAYVAGPGEYRYLTRQAAALYPRLGVTPQRPVPRWSGTLIEPWADRLLDRLGLSADALLGDDGTVGRQVLRRDLPDEIPIALAQLRDAIQVTTNSLVAAGRTIDGVLARAIASRQRRLSTVADDLEHLLERHLRKRGDIGYAQYLRLRQALRPHGAPQERALSTPSFLARHGNAWPAAVRAATETWAARLEADPAAG